MSCTQLAAQPLVAGQGAEDRAQSSIEQKPKPLVVLVTIKPIQLLVQAVLGDTAEVQYLLPENMTPHNYALTPKDIASIDQADLVFWMGESLEPYLSKVFSVAGADVGDGSLVRKNDQGSVIVDLMGVSGLRLQRQDSDHAHGHDESIFDPHMWLAADNASVIADAILEAAIIKRPRLQKRYQKNSKEFKAALNKQASVYQEKFDRLYEIEKSTFVTFHNAYGYLHYYHFPEPVVGNDVPHQQLSMKQLFKVKQLIAQHSVKCAVVGLGESDRLAKKLLGMEANVVRINLMAAGVLSYDAYMKGILDSFLRCLDQP